MLKREFTQHLCISLVALLAFLDLYLNYAHYPAIKIITCIVIIALSLLFLFLLILVNDKWRYFFLIIAYTIVLGIYLPFLYPNNYATFSHLFTFWHLGLCLVLMVISGLIYPVKHIIAMIGANVVLMLIAFRVLYHIDIDHSEFNPVLIFLFYLFSFVYYFLCDNLKKQHTSDNSRIIEFDNKMELIQNENKMFCRQAIVYDSYFQKLDELHKSIANFIDTQFDGVDHDKAKELKKMIRHNESEMKQLSSEIKGTKILSLISILSVNYPTISKSEAEVAVYTYYNYPDKVIARLTNLNNYSVSRYRMNIKKKMEVDSVKEMKQKLTDLFRDNVEF